MRPVSDEVRQSPHLLKLGVFKLQLIHFTQGIFSFLLQLKYKSLHIGVKHGVGLHGAWGMGHARSLRNKNNDPGLSRAHPQVDELKCSLFSLLFDLNGAVKCL